MNKKKYYIIDSKDENLKQIISSSVGSLDEQRYSTDRTKIVIKLKDEKASEFLEKYQRLNNYEAFYKMQEPEWNKTL